MNRRLGILCISAPGFALAGLMAAVFLSEWYIVAIRADPHVIADYYHFGSEAMLGNGGWHYATPELYSFTALIEGSVAMAIAAAFAIAVARRSGNIAIGAYALLAVGLVANQVFIATGS